MLVAGNLNHFSFARDAHRFSHGSDFVTVSAGIHPECAADCSRNSAESFDSRQTRARNVDAKSRQRITRADRNEIAVDVHFAFHIAQAQNHVMMIAIVGEHVAAGAERSPADARLVQLMNDRRRLLFGVGRDDPIDRAADTQTGQLGKALSTLRAHSQSRRDLFERPIALFQLSLLRPRHSNYPGRLSSLSTTPAIDHSLDSLCPRRASTPDRRVEHVSRNARLRHFRVGRCNSTSL